ncbi:MAG TPA: hypothetical protein VIX83_13625 [Candidatus Cybelea sp.]
MRRSDIRLAPLLIGVFMFFGVFILSGCGGANAPETKSLNPSDKIDVYQLGNAMPVVTSDLALTNSIQSPGSLSIEKA